MQPPARLLRVSITWTRLLGAILLGCASAVVALATDTALEIPASGPWQGFRRGTYVIVKRTMANPPSGVFDKPYMKTMLVNVSPTGGVGFTVFQADSAEGPWVVTIPSVGSSAESDGALSYRRTELGEKKISIDGKTFTCTEIETSSSNDWGTKQRVELVDKESKTVLRLDSTYSGQDHTGRRYQTTLSRATHGLVRMEINDVQLDCFSQVQVEKSGTREERWEETVSPVVPNRMVRLIHFSDGGSIPSMEQDLVTWGFEPDWEAQYHEARKKHGIVGPEELAEREEARRRELLENERKLAKYWQSRMDELVSTVPDKRADAIRVISEWKPDRPLSAEVDAAILSALDDSSPEVRRQAAIGLGKRHLRGYSTRIIQLLNADSAGTFQYIEALELQQDDTALNTILQYAAQENPHWRRLAVSALARFSNPAIRTVLEKSARDTEWGVRLSAIKQLGQIADPQSAPVVRQALHDDNPLVAGAAAEAVIKLHDRNAIPALLQLAASTDEMARFNAHAALGRIATPQDESVLTFLLPQLEDVRSPAITAAAILALGQMKADAAVQSLIKLLESDKSFTALFEMPLGVSAAMALGQIGTPTALHALEQRLGSPQHELMCRAMALAGPVSAQPLLKHFLLSANRGHREAELKALATVGTQEIADALQKYLPDCPPPEKPAVRETITHILKRVATDAPVQKSAHQQKSIQPPQKALLPLHAEDGADARGGVPNWNFLVSNPALHAKLHAWPKTRSSTTPRDRSFGSTPSA